MRLQDRSRRSLCAVIASVCSMLAPSLADASAQRVGSTINASGMIGSMVTDLAQDPVNDVYLMVSGQLTNDRRVYGRFVQGDGTVLGAGPFFISAGYAMQPRVTYSAAIGGFLVIWIDINGRVWGRFVQYTAGGAPAYPTGDFLIATPLGGAPSDKPPALACAGSKAECLVAWGQIGQRHTRTENDIRGVRVSLTGQRLGEEYVLTNDTVWQTDPTVAYDPAAGIYLLAHTHVPNGSEVWVHRIQADSGTLLGSHVAATGSAIYRPELAYNSRTGEFFVTYHDLTYVLTYGRFMKSDGTLIGGAKPLIGRYTGRDSNGVAYNAASNSYFAVIHGLGHEIMGYEISSEGNASLEFQATDIRGPEPTFYPRVAAHSARREWMLTSSAWFTFTAGQRITTDTALPEPPPPPPPTGENEVIDLSPAGAPNGSWFMAEGISHDLQHDPNGFITFYLMVNENNEPVTVRAYFSRQDGRTFSRTVTIPANSRETFNLAEVAGLGTFGAVFQSLTPGLDIFVERSVYWGQMEGSTGEVATRSLAFEWNFGEGSRDYFSNYFLVFNPNQAAGSATFTFFLESGGTVQHEMLFGPQQRITLDASTLPQLAEKNFGVKITSTVPVVAERAMYFDYRHNGFIGGTASIGAPGLSNSWFFAEGFAGTGFQTYYLLMNPNAFPITVDRWFFLEDGTKLQGSYTVDPGSRRTIWLNQEMGQIEGTAAQFTSASPFIAERSTYWGASGWVEGTNAIGSPLVASEWHVPEGTEGGDFDSYLLLFNPGSGTVTADLVLYFEDLGRFTAPVHLRPVVGPQSRLSINMREFIHRMEDAASLGRDTLTQYSFSTKVKTLSGEGIVVEHALYRLLDGSNLWRSGSVSFGVPR
jgi:hypothetical protein